MFAKFKSFEEIVAPLSRIEADLELLSERNNGVVGKNLQTIERLNQHNEELNAENLKAGRFLAWLGQPGKA